MWETFGTQCFITQTSTVCPNDNGSWVRRGPFLMTEERIEQERIELGNA